MYYSQVDARGDEGTIFYYNPDESPDDLIFKAIQFSYELKARIELLDNDSPKSMKVGIGIHFDKVAIIPEILNDEKGTPRSVIGALQGFSINYAKRIESCSRVGKYSKIILSKKAASCLDGDPIVFTKQLSDLKGIERSEEVFEVQSVFIDKLPYDKSFHGSEEFIEKYQSHEETCDFIQEPWQKSVALSVLSTSYNDARTKSLQARYKKSISELTWLKPMEDDPILLFTRAKLCGEDEKYTQKLEYLRNLVKAYPEFIHARIKLAGACCEVSQKAEERVELVFERNIADEFLNKFNEYLSTEERKLYKQILEEQKVTSS